MVTDDKESGGVDWNLGGDQLQNQLCCQEHFVIVIFIVDQVVCKSPSLVC